MKPFKVNIVSSKIKNQLKQLGWNINSIDFNISSDSIENFINDISNLSTRVNIQFLDDKMIISEQYELMMKAMSNVPPKQSGKCQCCGK